MGQFLDLGVGGALYTSRTYIYEDPLQGKEWQEVRIKNHRAILQYNSYLLGRLGVNNFSLGVRYRITPFFSENSNYPAAPPILIDFTWGFF